MSRFQLYRTRHRQDLMQVLFLDPRHATCVGTQGRPFKCLVVIFSPSRPGNILVVEPPLVLRISRCLLLGAVKIGPSRRRNDYRRHGSGVPCVLSNYIQTITMTIDVLYRRSNPVRRQIILILLFPLSEPHNKCTKIATDTQCYRFR